MPIDEKLLEEGLCQSAIQRLLAAYADVVNRGQWHALSQLFLEAAQIELTTLQREPLVLVGPEALGRFISGVVARFDFFQFVVSNARIELEPDAQCARGRIFICEYRWEQSAARWTQVFGVYRDRYRRIDGRWWFEHRRFDPLASVASRDEVTRFASPLEPFLESDA